MRKILYNKPWLLPVLAFVGFVCLWTSFIIFAVKHKPAEVPRLAPASHQAEVTNAHSLARHAAR